MAIFVWGSRRNLSVNRQGHSREKTASREFHAFVFDLAPGVIVALAMLAGGFYIMDTTSAAVTEAVATAGGCASLT